MPNNDSHQHVVKTSAQWNDRAIEYWVVPRGCLCVELTSRGKTKLKVGEGNKYYAQLPYICDIEDLSDYYTKEEINNLFNNLNRMAIMSTEEYDEKSDLPLTGNKLGDVRFVKSSSPSLKLDPDIYLWNGHKWIFVGYDIIDIDLSQYIKREEFEPVAAKVDEMYPKMHTHENKETLDRIEEPYTTAEKDKLDSLENYDDTEIRALIRQATHVHPNKSILDQIQQPFKNEDKTKLDSLENYDDTELRDRISDVEAVAHTHSNKDELDSIYSGFVDEHQVLVEFKTTAEEEIDDLNNDVADLKTKIHTHSNKNILDSTTAPYTTQDKATLDELASITIFDGASPTYDGFRGYVPAPHAGEQSYFLRGDGIWAKVKSGSGDKYKAGDGIFILSGEVISDAFPFKVYSKSGHLSKYIIYGNTGGVGESMGGGVYGVNISVTDEHGNTNNTSIILPEKISFGDYIDYEKQVFVHMRTNVSSLVNTVDPNYRYRWAIRSNGNISPTDVGAYGSSPQVTTLVELEPGTTYELYHECSYPAFSNYMNLNVYDVDQNRTRTMNFYDSTGKVPTIIALGPNEKYIRLTWEHCDWYPNTLIKVKAVETPTTLPQIPLFPNSINTINVTNTIKPAEIYVEVAEPSEDDPEDPMSEYSGIIYNDGVLDITQEDPNALNELTVHFRESDKVITVPTGNTYTAGGGIDIDANDEISAKLGSGLQFDANGAIEVTSGGGGDSYVEGQGIEFTPDPRSAELPNTYQQIEYLQGTGTQGIILNYTPMSTTPTDIKYELTYSDLVSEPTGWHYLIGGWLESSHKMPPSIVYSNNNYQDKLVLSICEADIITNGDWPTGNTVHTSIVTIDGSTAKMQLDSGTESSGTWSGSIDHAPAIFASNRGSGALGSFSAYKFRELKIYENDILIHHYYPCYRKSDNEPGIYDVITNTFLTNNGTGDFICGNDVNYDDTFINAKLGNGLSFDNNDAITVDEMTGASASTDGDSGAVPAPLAGDENKFLRGDGTWQTVSGGTQYQAGAGIGIQQGVSESYHIVEYLESKLSDRSQAIDTGYKKTQNLGMLNIQLKWRLIDEPTASANVVTSHEPDAAPVTGCIAISVCKGTSMSYFAPCAVIFTSDGWNGSTNFQYDSNNHDATILRTDVCGWDDDGDISLNAESGPYHTDASVVWKNIFLFDNVPARIYFCRIFDNDTLVRDLVPCVRDSDNIQGFYDKVEKVFYPNPFDQPTSTDYISGPETGEVVYDFTHESESDPYIITNKGIIDADYDSQNLELTLTKDDSSLTIPVGDTVYTAGENIIITGEREEFTKLEYIQGKGNQNINTHKRIRSGHGKFAVDFQFVHQPESEKNRRYEFIIATKYVGNEMPVGSPIIGFARNGSGGSYGTMGGIVNGTNSFSWYWINSSSTTDRTNVNVEYFPDTKIGINGTVYSTDNWPVINDGELYLFGTSDYKCWAKLYSVKIWDDDVLIFDGIPVKRNSDNEVGIFDKCNNEFFINDLGGGALGFKAGPVESGADPVYGNYVGRTKTISAVSYTLPIASDDTLGGVKVGSGLEINEDGVLSTLDGVEYKAGAGISITDGGPIDTDYYFDTQVSCNLSGNRLTKTFTKYNTEPAFGAIVSVYTNESFTGPVFVGRTPDSVKYTSNTGNPQGTVVYRDETWYYSTFDGWVDGERVDTLNNMQKIEGLFNTPAQTEDIIFAILDAAYGSPTVTEKEISVIPATTETIGGVIVGDGLDVNEDGILSVSDRKTYVAGDGITITDSTSFELSEDTVTNTVYFFDTQVTSSISGRTYTKYNTEPALGAVVYASSYTQPYFVGLTVDSVKYGTDYDSQIWPNPGHPSFEYKGVTWYYSGFEYAMYGDGTDTSGHMQKLSGSYSVSTEADLQNIARAIIDAADIITNPTKRISAKLGSGLQFDSNKAVELDKATTETIGGVIVGDGLEIDEEGVLSATGGSGPSETYIAGDGIDISRESSSSFDVTDPDYYFDTNVQCSINGRTFTKYTTEPALAAILTSSTDLSGPFFVGLSETAVAYTQDYDSEISHAAGSFEYLGYTWYYTNQAYWMSGSHTDLMGNLQKITGITPTSESWELAAKVLIDTAGVIPSGTEIISAKIGTGLTFDSNNAIELDNSIKIRLNCNNEPN